MRNNKYDILGMPAGNGRFGASGGGGSLESLCDFERFAPVRTAVKAPPAPSRWDVKRKRGATVQQNNKTKN